MSLSQAVVTTDSSESTAASGSVTSTDGAGVSTGNAAHKCGICSQNFLSLELLKVSVRTWSTLAQVMAWCPGH